MRKGCEIIASIISALIIIWIAAVGTVLAIASNEDFYKDTLRDVGVYSTENEDGTERRRIIYGIGGDMAKRATLSDEQLDTVVEHIVGYLFGGKESFELKLDGVRFISGKTLDGVSIFGEEAVSHMKDVKGLIHAVEISLIPSLLLLVLLFIYLYKRVRARDVIKYILLFLLAILVLAALFCLWSYLGSTEMNPFLLNLWGNLHYIIFAFNADAYAGSFLTDALVYILTLDFFMKALGIVLLAIAVALAAYLAALLLIGKLSDRGDQSPKIGGVI